MFHGSLILIPQHPPLFLPLSLSSSFSLPLFLPPSFRLPPSLPWSNQVSNVELVIFKIIVVAAFQCSSTIILTNTNVYALDLRDHPALYIPLLFTCKSGDNLTCIEACSLWRIHRRVVSVRETVVPPPP